jgi:acetyl esterase/lipase
LDDSINVATRARDDGVDVTLAKWENMVHAFPIMAPFFPEATSALREICDFMKRHLGD